MDGGTRWHAILLMWTQLSYRGCARERTDRATRERIAFHRVPSVRRDVNQDQRFALWKKINAKSEAWQKAQREIQEEANRKRSASTRDRCAIKRAVTRVSTRRVWNHDQ
jgi:hypothetical protein